MITIVTPSYNSVKFIELQYERLKPILSNTIRWLIVDDCSSDCTFEFVNSFQTEFVSCHKLDVNSGPSKARHMGALLAKTKYIFFLDADDFIFNNNFFEFYNFIIENNCGDYFFAPTYISDSMPRYDFFDPEQEQKVAYIKRPTDFIYYGMPNYSSLAMNREFFISNVKENNLPWGEDILSYLQMGNYGVGIKWIKPVSCYVITGSGRGSSLSLSKRIKLFYNLLRESINSQKKTNSFIFSLFLILRFTCSYIYKRVRG